MFIVRRRWTRRGLRMVLAGLALGTGWFLYQTRSAAIIEFYALITRPFQSDSALVQQQQLTNARVQELQERVKELEQQNQQLKSLLGYFEDQPQPAITAPVIGRSSDDWWQQVILGRGSRDGVEKGAAVTGIGGLVGRISEVTPHTSRVLLISNPTSRVGATITRSRSMGLIQGQGSKIAVMQFFEKVPDVRPGDTVTTSSVSRLFPSGLPIGRVKSVNLEARGPAPEAQIELIAPINNLEWVIIHPLKRQDELNERD
ncbi:rod shape-determining protein MreC [Gloeothece citriformis PCC 7424]|uniref:Cell shape-determining protein MreC n=1 Tax=Gloeothece citriformis (strain PCC 7424) TaxID=65393 RepID=B7KF69_GLOC7|nr:rod shape-determining protein MreC [Gloeothece citriformis]ACK71785.1 rod shape-determining protein MreC [Gloeothece citriformis PCC 7424]